MLFLSNKNKQSIRYCNIGEGQKSRKLNLNRITDIAFGNRRGNFNKLPKLKLSELDPNLCLSIFANTLSFDIIFINLVDLIDFCFSVIYIQEGEKEELKKS